MKIHVLGGHGGLSQGFATTSFLIDENLLIDAGAVAASLGIEEQKKINHILITHIHLDHIKDLAFICDNCFGQRNEAFRVYTHATVKQMLLAHLFNDIIWPDFTKLPSIANPTLTIDAVRPEESLKIGDYTVKPVCVQHDHDAMGYIVEKNDSSVLFSGDTGPTDRIWEIAHSIKNLKAIFTEVSFPNRLQQVATVSNHHTARTLYKDVLKMPSHIPIILTHLKPNFRQEVIQEVQSLNESRIHVLDHDGEIFNF